VEARIDKVTDWAEIQKYPILATPGPVINENKSKSWQGR
jgi:hypothetical protein